MKQRLSAVAALVLGSALALPASAQSIKPGLWEITNTLGSADGQMQATMAQMQKEMAEMEPEERKMMEEMMAKQGVQFGGTAGGGMRTTMCITPEMAKRNDLMVQQQGDCKHTRSAAVGGKMTFSFVCNNPRTTGDGEMSFAGDTGYKMKMKVVSGTARSDVMTMDASGKWLGADCGSVKPFAMPKAK
jgi:hypothetical protein